MPESDQPGAQLKKRRTYKSRAKPRSERPHAIETDLRAAEVASLMLSHFTRAQICQLAAAKWGSSKGLPPSAPTFQVTVGDQSLADRLIVRAKKLIQDRIAANRDKTIDDHLDALRDMVRRARGLGDIRLEHEIAIDLAKLSDYYPAARSKIVGIEDELAQLVRNGQASITDVATEFPELAKQVAVLAGVAFGGK